jgi:formylglycine-generating enzyme required for sulfatase activity
MIKQIIILLFVIISLAFNKSNFKKFIPPGTVKINDTLFADETEVSNLSWLEFEYWTCTKYGKNSSEYKAVVPDTLVWRNKESFNEPYVHNYYRHKAYRNFPVVGITFEQAIAFCKWRTERVKEFYGIAYKKSLKIEYKLPSKEEWEFISNLGSGIFNNKGKNEKGLFSLNCIREDFDTLNTSQSKFNDVTAPVYSYWKNYFGLFNMIGNVAEMIDQKNICKGGSWKHHLNECRVGKDIQYTKSEAWLGFRCVCILK